MIFLRFIKKCLYLALIILFFATIPEAGQANLTGGDYRIFADSFSVIEDQYTAGGVYGLYGTGGEFSAGIVGPPITGSITITTTSLAVVDFNDTFTISDGYRSVTFMFNNMAGGMSGSIDGGNVVVDTGGGFSDTPEDFADQFVIAINSANHPLEVTASHNTNDGVVLLQNDHGEAVGIVAIIDNVATEDIVFSGMSQSSGAYSLRGGFQAMEIGALSLALSTTSISLGNLNLNTVASSSLAATVSSDGGYVVSITEDGNLRDGANDIDDIGAGNVTAGTEGYGIRTTGIHGQQNNVDAAITGGSLTIASSNNTANSVETVIDFKAAVGTNSVAGNYSHTVTFSITSSL